jgi:hypothetical protein
MQKFVIAFVVTDILTAPSRLVLAQKAMDKAQLNNFKNETAYVSSESSKRVITETSNNNNRLLYKINFKAVRDFMTTYPSITNEKWEILKDGYMVSVVLNRIWIKNYYDTKGNWLHSIQQYDQTKLPEDIRVSVKSVFYDYSITIVEEFNNERNNLHPIYFVHLKYANTFKIIRVCDGELEEVTL